MTITALANNPRQIGGSDSGNGTDRQRPMDSTIYRVLPASHRLPYT